METQKRKKTPPMDNPWRLPPGFWEFIMPSQIKARLMPIVPKIRGLRRPTRSRMKTIKMKSGVVSICESGGLWG